MSGWIGTRREMLYALRTFGAEQDGDGKLLIAGELPATFLGLDTEDAETVVSERVLCRINGQWVGVANLLQQTSYGLKINVI